MAGRRLSPEEAQIWSKVAQTVHPLRGTQARPTASIKAELLQGAASSKTLISKPAKSVHSPAKKPVAVLDGSWEKRIATGALIPEMSVDLHGHTLESAHRHLNHMLGIAISRNVRVVLVITGNPRSSAKTVSGERTRGAIRAEIGDWLALGGYSDAIASVRTAHPRHGGKGALYIILRRKKIGPF